MITPQAKQLRKYFNIENIKEVKLTRVMNAVHPLYLVVLDSRRPTFPINTSSVISALPRNFLYSNGRNTPLLPFVDLDRYQGNINTAMYMLIDLAGSLRQRNKYTEDTSKLLELTVLDLKDKESISKLTRIFYDERRGIVGEGNSSVKLIDCTVKTQEDYVEWGFLTESTYDDDPQQTDHSKAFKLENNPSKTYEMYVRIPKFFEWLDTRPGDDPLTRDDLREVFNNVDVKIACNCPAFHWQSINYNLTVMGASIYPTNIAPTSGPKGWKDRQKDAFLCKHLAQLFRHISFFEQPMVSMLNKRIKDKQIFKEGSMEETKEIEEDVVTSGSVDQGVVKTDLGKDPKTLDEGFVNIAVEIDKQFGMTKDPLSQYQREINNKKDADAALTLHQLKTALRMHEGTIVDRFVEGSKSLESYSKAVDAIKIVEGKLTEDLSTHLAGKLFTEMVILDVVDACEDKLDKVTESINNIGIAKFDVESIIKDLIENGAL